MPTFNLTAIGAALLIYLATTIGAFFYGRSAGIDHCQAQQSAAIEKGFKDLKKGSDAQAADDEKKFNERMARLDNLTGAFSKQGDQINDAASRLKISLASKPSLAGACVLDPGDRRLLECVRRPGGTGCATP